MKKLYFFLFTILLANMSFGQIISEFDADQAGTDSAEFIEIQWSPNTSLNGYIIVLFNGNGDISYNTVDLTGETTDANGFFVINFPSNGIQNGPDAIALYMDSASNFPNGTAPTTTNLVDAVVYGTNDSDDTALMNALGETVQYNDDTSNSLNQSGDGTFYLAAPSSGVTNNTLSSNQNQIKGFALYPNPANGFINISSKSNAKISVAIFDMLGKQVINTVTNNETVNISSLNTGIYMLRAVQDNATTTTRLVVK
ncbi:T9SS type A sorting domain-containing protein [Seonamhaeicola algicola]|uniref:T9SS type A sorting domain-containing protein n=1 Tax=Seonamhaeicola algicola TaxID=1719036 RepID=A0A5C7AM13_9FLAO|nr:T9SS type A sorting domain-containing protein [Seonamhaeicola algicola]TXE09638.1 T9SS type A sorting domain-containing protein [Seonamhaeicola algicola]